MRGEKSETEEMRRVKFVKRKEIKGRRGWKLEGLIVSETSSSYGTCA